MRNEKRVCARKRGRTLHNCREIAKYPTKGLHVTQALAPGIGVVPSANLRR